MDKIYRLRMDANFVLCNRGHVVGKYDREFRIDNGKTVKILRSRCSLCGAPILLIDYPKPGEKEISGSAYEYNCKKGAGENEVPLFSKGFGVR